MANSKISKDTVIDVTDPHEIAHHSKYSPEGVTVTVQHGDGEAIEVESMVGDDEFYARRRMSESLGYRKGSAEHQRIQNLEARFLRPAKMNARDAAAAVIEEWVGKGKP